MNRTNSNNYKCRQWKYEGQIKEKKENFLVNKINNVFFGLGERFCRD